MFAKLTWGFTAMTTAQTDPGARFAAGQQKDDLYE